jgi:hypothetical protein
MKKAQRDDGVAYYEYVLIYTDDILVISDNPRETLLKLNKYFLLKKGSLGKPDVHLGAKVTQMTLPNGVKAWGLGLSQYCQEAPQCPMSKSTWQFVVTQVSQAGRRHQWQTDTVLKLINLRNCHQNESTTTRR